MLIAKPFSTSTILSKNSTKRKKYVQITPFSSPNPDSTTTAIESTATAVQSEQTPLEQVQASLVQSISEIGEHQWDACHDNSNPFITYQFLHALEESLSVSASQGWLPQHFCIKKDQTVLACVPMYLKGHSFGEYVFDNAWAQAYEQHFVKPTWNNKETGYYPKLQSCVPFTPVTGSRILLRQSLKDSDESIKEERLIAAAVNTLGSLPKQLGYSSLHMTFNTEKEYQSMGRGNALCRLGVQYHWHNTKRFVGKSDGERDAQRNCESHYSDFDDFLSDLQQKKRKIIRQERKKVANEGLRIDRLTGGDVQHSRLWDAFYEFYVNTVDRKWGSAYLTREFFEIISNTMADKILLVTAKEKLTAHMPEIGGASSRGGRNSFNALPIAAALNLIGSDAIYGRNWGCIAGDSIKGLHFELCYYQAIEYAIENSLSRVEAGAQGEHKLARGYLPALTYSNHFIANEDFRDVLESFLIQERAQLQYFAASMKLHESPFKHAEE